MLSSSSVGLILTDDDNDDAGSHESADNEMFSGTTGRMGSGRRRPKEPTPRFLNSSSELLVG